VTGMPNGGSYEHCWAMVVVLRGEMLNGMGFCVVFRHCRFNMLRFCRRQDQVKDQVSGRVQGEIGDGGGVYQILDLSDRKGGRKVDPKLENGSKESVGKVETGKFGQELPKRQVSIDQRDASAIQTDQKQRDTTNVHVGSGGYERKSMGGSGNGKVRLGFKDDKSGQLRILQHFKRC
jgi:hypothetical protein